MTLRRLVIAPAAWRAAREQYAAVVAERDDLARQLQWILRDLADVSDRLREFRATMQEKWAAEERLAELYRERAIASARAAERDSGTSLH
jgi:hypothetical protein